MSKSCYSGMNSNNFQKNRSNKGPVLCGLVVLLLLFSFLGQVQGAAGKMPLESSKHVLFISSYSLGWESVPEQIKGLKQALDPVASMESVFLYGKELSEQDAMTRAGQSFSALKLLPHNYDLLIAGDDLALEFVLENRQKLFAEVPLVFLGINTEATAQKAAKLPGVTGVVESFPMDKTIALAKKLYPRAEKVIAITDNTASGQGSLEQFLACQSAFPQLKFQVINAGVLTKQDLVKQLDNINGKNYIVLFLMLTKDKEGNYYSLKDGVELVTSHVHQPVFKSDEVGVSYGLFGGNIMFFKDMGELAGSMAVDILRGRNPHTLPVAVTPTKYAFNKRVMTKFGINAEKLPSDAVFLEDDTPSLKINKNVMISIGTSVMAVVLVIMVLLYDNRRNKKMNKALQASEKSLQLSRAGLQAAVEHANVYYWEYYPQEDKAIEGERCQNEFNIPAIMYDYPQSWVDAKIIHPKDVDVLLQLHADIKNGASKATCDIRNMMAGVYRWERLDYTVIERDDEGKPLKAIATSVSIQKEKDIENRYREQINYRNIIRQMAISYAKLNITTNRPISIIHPGEDDMTARYATADDFLHYLLQGIKGAGKLHEIKALAGCAQLVTAFEQGITHREYEVLYDYGDGKPLWIRLTIDLLYNPLNDILECFLYAFDINKRKLAEEEDKVQLALALKEAKLANAAKNDFVSMMSHEIRTPMNAIVGFTTLALEDCQDGRIRDYLAKINFASEVLQGLISDILDMSRIENNKIVIQPEPVEVKPFLEGLLLLVRDQIDKKHIKLVTNFATITYPKVKLDKLRCQQIFMNLFGNAVKFTEVNGRIELAIYVDKIEQNTVYTTIVVKDNGIGMSQEFLSRVFEPFEQENDARAINYPGTGLGMAITKNLVELMGGTISVESQKEQGTTFTLKLPFEILADDTQIATGLDLSRPVDLSGKRILLVEDQYINIEIAQNLLLRQGCLVEVAQNGALAVEKFCSAPEKYYDVILMDIRMPVMDGIEATKIIRAAKRSDAKTIPIIAMTANAFLTDVKATQKAGMTAHLSKPVMPAQMFAVISQTMGLVKNG